MGHESKCATAHGHNYLVYVTAEAPHLDSVGRVIDFSVLKSAVGTWIDENWDHTFLVSSDDTDTITALKTMPGAKEPFICPFNPTAEEIASYLLGTVCPSVLDHTDVTITKVEVRETENCFAEAQSNQID
ncbi:6-pyruvoyl tetrahydrobiopterin synthase [Mycolicibacillus koreensis]|nr:6-pyruvoyl tetrahydrobiopterin synthase [Mycolicibacillus koreensis]